MWSVNNPYSDKTKNKALGMISSMNSGLICPWFSWAPLLPSWTNFILANKQTPEISYLFSWQSGRCMFICPCIWEGPDVELKKKEKALGCHRSKPPASWDLKWDDTSNIQHTGPWILDCGQAPWREVYKTLTSLDDRVSSFSGQRRSREIGLSNT